MTCRVCCRHMKAHKLVVMGVAGSGKSTLGEELARTLGLPLIEGDHHHLPPSKAKMRAGIALHDADREPWPHPPAPLLARASGGPRSHPHPRETGPRRGAAA